jgi:hypothetical protein
LEVSVKLVYIHNACPVFYKCINYEIRKYLKSN